MANDSPLRKHDVVDLVSTSKDDNLMILSIVADEPWDDERVLDLQAKLKNYLSYVENGSLFQDFPESSGKTICFRLHSEFPLNERAEHFIDLAKRQWLSPAGIHWQASSLAK